MKSLVVLLVSLVSFAAGAWTNGALWYDTNGHVVNAHGGGVLTHKGRFYLYGEHKIYSGRGNRAHRLHRERGNARPAPGCLLHRLSSQCA